MDETPARERLAPDGLRRAAGVAWLVLPPLLLLACVCAPRVVSDWLGSFSPGCAFRRLTGVSCPGCGGTRAARALLSGDIWDAFRYNMFLPPSLALLAVEYVRSWLALLRGRRAPGRFYVRLVQVYALATCAWFVLRNLFGV